MSSSEAAANWLAQAKSDTASTTNSANLNAAHVSLESYVKIVEGTDSINFFITLDIFFVMPHLKAEKSYLSIPVHPCPLVSLVIYITRNVLAFHVTFC